jgi:DNA-binding MarR family transcriptional regulator
MFQRERSAGYLANLLARRFAQALGRRIASHGVTVGVFPVLLGLWEEDGVTQADLVERLGVEQPTVANTLGRMERDGLVERRDDPSDGRLSRVYLTRRGRDLRGPLTGAAAAVNRAALAGLSPTERESLLALIRRVVANLEREAPKRSRPRPRR